MGKKLSDYSKTELLNMLWAKEKENPTIKIRFPADILPSVFKWRNKKQEHFIVTTLDGSHNIIKTRVITKGLVGQTAVHPREIFRLAISDNATAVILYYIRKGLLLFFRR
jgi:DNA repair protein RadC